MKTSLKEIVQILLTTPNSIFEHPLGGPMYPTKKPTNMRFQ
jgi:hypothetical protein